MPDAAIEAPAPKKPAKSGDDVAEVQGSEAAYARFLPTARDLDAAEIVPMRGDASLAHHNAAIGVGEVMKYEDHLLEHLPKVDLAELTSLPDLALAVAFASAAAAGESAAEIRALVGEALAIRRLLLKAAEAAVEASLLTAQDLAKVKQGRGPIDAASDCVALATIFTRHAEALAGKTALTAEQVDHAAELGADLLRRLKAKAPRRKADAGAMSPIEARDRLWTLLCQRHERLWAVGAYVFGHAVDEMVPDLLAPPARKKRGKAREKAAEG